MQTAKKPPLTVDLESEIISRLRAGESRRTIHAALGCSMWSVIRVAYAMRGVKPPRSRRNRNVAYHRVDPYWCDACHATVVLDPCPACQARNLENSG
jgi:hypothetical protein